MVLTFVTVFTELVKTALDGVWQHNQLCLKLCKPCKVNLILGDDFVAVSAIQILCVLCAITSLDK